MEILKLEFENFEQDFDRISNERRYSLRDLYILKVNEYMILSQTPSMVSKIRSDWNYSLLLSTHKVLSQDLLTWLGWWKFQKIFNGQFSL